jgi:hypothetical protein
LLAPSNPIRSIAIRIGIGVSIGLLAMKPPTATP